MAINPYMILPMHIYEAHSIVRIFLVPGYSPENDYNSKGQSLELPSDNIGNLVQFERKNGTDLREGRLQFFFLGTTVQLLAPGKTKYLHYSYFRCIILIREIQNIKIDLA